MDQSAPLKEFQDIAYIDNDTHVAALFETIMLYPADEIARAIPLFEKLHAALDINRNWNMNDQKWSWKLTNAVSKGEPGAHHLVNDYEDRVVSQPGYDRRASIYIEDGSLHLVLTTASLLGHPVGNHDSNMYPEDVAEKGDVLLSNMAIAHLVPSKLRARFKQWHQAVHANAKLDEESGKPAFYPIMLRSKRHGGQTVGTAQALPQDNPSLSAVEYKASYSNDLKDMTVQTRLAAIFSIKLQGRKTGTVKAHNIIDLYLHHIFTPKQ